MNLLIPKTDLNFLHGLCFLFDSYTQTKNFIIPFPHPFLPPFLAQEEFSYKAQHIFISDPVIPKPTYLSSI